MDNAGYDIDGMIASEKAPEEAQPTETPLETFETPQRQPFRETPQRQEIGETSFEMKTSFKTPQQGKHQ